MGKLANIEFYTFEDEVWYRTQDGKNERLSEENRDIIKLMFDILEQFHSKAHKVLCSEFQKCRMNVPYFQFRVVQRFCKCNFGSIDNIPDVDSCGRLNYEHVSCPLRGECKLEGIVCHPEFDSKISDAEMRVLELLFKGYSNEEIADTLCLSIYTVRNHIRNSYTRLGLHEKAEFIDYAHRNKLFEP